MASYRRIRPALGWGGGLRTLIDTAAADVSAGWLARDWRYYGTNPGGGYIPFFGAPAVRGASSYGPVTATPADEVGIFGGDSPFTNWAVLGGWVDGTGIYTSQPDAWAARTFTGLTPTAVAGFRFGFGYTLDTGGGNVFGEIEGASVTRWSALDSGPTFWDLNGVATPVGGYITTIVPPSGDVVVRMGWENMGPTGSNGQGGFGDFELAYIGEGTRPKLLVWGTDAGAGAPKTWERWGRGSGRSKRFPSGRRSVWRKPGHDYLSMFVPYIPQVDRLRVGGPNGLDASGADGAEGWRAALEYARDGGVMTYYPDQDDLTQDPVDCVLVGPLADRYDRDDPSLLRGVELVLRTHTPGDVFPEY